MNCISVRYKKSNVLLTIKKEYRCTPTFVNLKSNTMKNTLQSYAF